MVWEPSGAAPYQYGDTGKEYYGLYWAFWLRKIHLLKTLNRMNDLVKGVRITGSVCYLGQDIHAPEVEGKRAAAADRHGIPEAESFSDEHIR